MNNYDIRYLAVRRLDRAADGREDLASLARAFYALAGEVVEAKGEGEELYVALIQVSLLAAAAASTRLRPRPQLFAEWRERVIRATPSKGGW